MSIITDNIDQILAVKRIGKYQFYADVGISAAAYAQWKRGKNKPRMDNLEAIARYLGVSVSTLTTEHVIDFDAPEPEEKKTAAPEGGGLSDAQIELLSLIRQLDPASLRYLTAKARELADFRKFLDDQG